MPPRKGAAPNEISMARVLSRTGGGSSRHQRMGAGNRLQQDRHHGGQDRAESLHAVRFGGSRPWPSGRGRSRVGVLTGADGILMVDAQYAQLAEKIHDVWRDRIESR